MNHPTATQFQNMNLSFSSNVTVTKQAHWSFISIMSLLICGTAAILNGSLLALFTTSQRLRTPFGKLLMNLLLGNFSYAVFDGVMSTAEYLYPIWWFGYHLCTVDLYFQYMLCSGAALCHVMITIDRIWAVAFPISFNQNFNDKAAYCLCALPWIFSHTVILSGVVLDALYYRQVPLELYGCIINTDVYVLKAWSLVFTFFQLFFTLIIVLAFPFIYLKEKKRQKIQAGTMKWIMYRKRESFCGTFLHQHRRTSVQPKDLLKTPNSKTLKAIEALLGVQLG